MANLLETTIACVKKTLIKEPCIIIMNDGGFGSQINKYLIGKYLEKYYNVAVKHDLTWFEEYGKSVDGKQNRNFDLSKVYPNLRLLVASKNEICEYKKYFRVEQKPIFEFPLSFADNNPPLYVDGYVFHYKYYEVIKEYVSSLLNVEIKLNEHTEIYLNKIKHTDGASVAVHIRRGDYIGTIHDILDERYYIAAIKAIHEYIDDDIVLYFFSNGFEWVEEKIIPYIENIKYELVQGNDNDEGYFDFMLMGKCNHQIVSNSSLSWIAAYANDFKNKKVIVPKVWVANMDCKDAFFFPGCIIMSNDGILVDVSAYK